LGWECCAHSADTVAVRIVTLDAFWAYSRINRSYADVIGREPASALRGGGGKISGARIKYCNPVDTLQASWVQAVVRVCVVHVQVVEVATSDATCAWWALITWACTVGETTAIVTVFSRGAVLCGVSLRAIQRRSIVPNVCVRAIERRINVLVVRSRCRLLQTSCAIVCTLVTVIITIWAYRLDTLIIIAVASEARSAVVIRTSSCFCAAGSPSKALADRLGGDTTCGRSTDSNNTVWTWTTGALENFAIHSQRNQAVSVETQVNWLSKVCRVIQTASVSGGLRTLLWRKALVWIDTRS
jgi:hypothetical protein